MVKILSQLVHFHSLEMGIRGARVTGLIKCDLRWLASAALLVKEWGHWVQWCRFGVDG